MAQPRYFDYPRTIFTEEQLWQRLAQRSGKPIDTIRPKTPVPAQSRRSGQGEASQTGKAEQGVQLARQAPEHAQEVPRGTLQWRKGPDDWSIVSACSVYTIRKSVRVAATDSGGPESHYEAYFRTPTQGEFSLGGRANAQEARALCNAHYAKMLSMRDMPVL